MNINFIQNNKSIFVWVDRKKKGEEEEEIEVDKEEEEWDIWLELWQTLLFHIIGLHDFSFQILLLF